MIDRFEGDPYISVSQDGADMHYINGQPVMDRGLSNCALISLLTLEGWVGNQLVQDNQSKIGSNFVKEGQSHITLTRMESVRQQAIKALNIDQFGQKEITITNPSNANIKVNIVIKPPNSKPINMVLDKISGNWFYQAKEPANEKVNNGFI